MNNRHYVPDPGKNGELLEVDTRDKKDLFKAISGQLEIFRTTGCQTPGTKL